MAQLTQLSCPEAVQSELLVIIDWIEKSVEVRKDGKFWEKVTQPDPKEFYHICRYIIRDFKYCRIQIYGINDVHRSMLYSIFTKHQNVLDNLISSF